MGLFPHISMATMTTFSGTRVSLNIPDLTFLLNKTYPTTAK